MNQPTLQPTNKVAAVGVAGLVVTLLVALASMFGVAIPPDVSSAALVAVSALVTIVTFVAGYMKKDKSR